MSSPTVLFYTDNGIGLGHLTRQAAIATHADGRFKPVFLTMSAGYTLLKGLGLPAEYFPSYGQLGITKQEWEPMVATRIHEMAHLVDARVLVVDHVSPPRIFGRLRLLAPGLKLVWVRRGLWQPGKNAGALRTSAEVDLIVEPGDLAAPVDQGATVARRQEAVRTEPVVLVDRNEFLARKEAREALGIPRSGRAVLINLGDADPTEIGRFISRAADVITAATSGEVHLFAPLHPLHGNDIPRDPRVIMAPVYPTSRYLNAFDGVVSTSGYNSFHEIMGSGLPAVFIPHSGASIDDQPRRAEFASLSGRAHWAQNVFDPAFETSIKRMLRPGESHIARETTEILGALDGAREIAEILARVAGEARVSWFESIQVAPPPSESETIGADSAEGRLITVLEHDDRELRELAASLDSADCATSVFVVRDGNPRPLYEKGAVFESVMSEAEWASLARSSYSRYVEARLRSVQERYRLRRTMALETRVSAHENRT